MSPQDKPSFRYALLVSSLIAFGIYKAAWIGLERFEIVALSWGVDACAWLALWAVSEAACRSARMQRAWLPAALFFPLFYTSVLTSFAHTFFFDAAIDRRFSVLDVGMRGIAFFFESVLTVEGWIVLSVLLCVMHAGAWLARERLHYPRLSALAITGGLLVAGTATASARVEKVPSPLADLARDVTEMWRMPRVEPAAQPRYPAALLDRSARSAQLAPSPYRHVLVFVMETMTLAKLQQESAALEPSTFFRSASPHLHEYARYYPSNQDSRTGMLGMLSPRHNPLEAYTDEAVAGYEHLSRLPSLVDRMNALGYASAFAIAQDELELVVRDLAWKQILNLSPEEIEAAKRTHLCLNPYEFEHSCEDLALLPEVLDLLDREPHVFLYQEFIWGHACEYNEASGRSNADYYSSYVDRVIEHLQKRGMLDETLIVLVSDHGFRDSTVQGDPAQYQIPLWFYQTAFAPRVEAGLYSHLDFAELLFHEMGSGPAPGENEFAMITGPTGTHLWAVLTADEDFMLFKSRGSRTHLLRHANVAGASARPPLDAAAPAAFVRLREDYLRVFGAGR